MANRSSLDEQAVFFEEVSDHRHVGFSQSLQRYREANFPTKLPSNLAETFRQDDRFRELQQGVETLTQRPDSIHTLKLAKAKLTQYRRKWDREPLRENRRNPGA